MNICNLTNDNESLMIIILHVNDRMKAKISKLSDTPTTSIMFCIFKIKSILKHIIIQDNLQRFHCSSVTPV